MLSEQLPLTLAAWAADFGPVVKMQLLHQRAVVVADPAAALSLTRWPSSPDYLRKPRELYDAFEIATGGRPNILTSGDTPYWRAVRQGTAPCFSISCLKQAFPWMIHLCGKAAAHVNALAAAAAAEAKAEAGEGAGGGGGAIVDVQDLAKRFTSDVMGRLLFDEDLGGMDMQASQYLELFGHLLEEIHHNFSNPLRRHLPAWWSDGVARGRRVVAEHDALMEAKARALAARPPPDYTITGHLLKVVDPATGRPLTIDQLKGEMGVFMGAGFETTSHAIFWTLAALATHPRAQQRLLEELAAAGLAPAPAPAAAGGAAARGAPPPAPPPPLAVQWSDLSALPYLSAVIKETLRLFSPASLGTTRLAHKDVEVLGHTVPKGTMVILPPYVAGVSAANYGETAGRFIPERWLGGGGGGGGSGGAALAKAAKEVEGGGSGDAAAERDQRAGREAGDGGKLPDVLAFSAGPRDCIGQSLAKIELQVLVATLAGRYRLEPAGALAARLVAAGAGANPVDVLRALSQYHVTLQPRGGMPLRLTPRRAREAAAA